MIKAHKIRLNPTPEQANYFARAAGTARFVWNWALAEWNRQYEAGAKPTALKLKKQFNAIRRDQFPWTWAKPLRRSLKARLAALASRARREARPASISPMISSSWVIIGSGYPSSDG